MDDCSVDWRVVQMDGSKAGKKVVRKGHRLEDCSADWMDEKLVDQSDGMTVKY